MSVTTNEKDGPEQPNGAPRDATCEFVLAHGPAGEMLRIDVHTMRDHTKEFPAYVATCSSSTQRVIGVGNEATLCIVRTGTITKRQIVGRVRRRAFVLSLSLPQPASEIKAEQVVLDQLQNIAQQVAGSLF